MEGVFYDAVAGGEEESPEAERKQMKKLFIGLNGASQKVLPTTKLGNRIDYEAVAYVDRGSFKISDNYCDQVQLSPGEARNLLKLLKVVLAPKKGKK